MMARTNADSFTGRGIPSSKLKEASRLRAKMWLSFFRILLKQLTPLKYDKFGKRLQCNWGIQGSHTLNFSRFLQQENEILSVISFLRNRHRIEQYEVT